MSHFDFEKLDVYQASIEVVVLIDRITESFPRGRAYLIAPSMKKVDSIVW